VRAKRDNPQPIDRNTYYTPQELAERLCIGVGAVEGLDLPHTPIGKRVRYHGGQVLDRLNELATRATRTGT
jgi:hypothetical protein